jgi:putative transposase
LNNRAENSHQPTRRRERIMKRFKSIARRSGMEERGDQACNLLSRPDDDCRATTQMQALC